MAAEACKLKGNMNAVAVLAKVAATVNYNCKLLIRLVTSGRCHNDKLNFDLKLDP